MALLAKKILRNPFRQRPENRYSMDRPDPASLKKHRGPSLSDDESMVETDTSFDSDGHSPIHGAAVAVAAIPAADAIECDERQVPRIPENSTPRVSNHERNRNRADDTTIGTNENEGDSIRRKSQSPIPEDATATATIRATATATSPAVKNEQEERSLSLSGDTAEIHATNSARGASENDTLEGEEKEAPSQSSGNLAKVKLEGQARLLQSHLPEGGYWNTSHRKRKRKPKSHDEFLYHPPPQRTRTTRKEKQTQPKQKQKQAPNLKLSRTETTKTSQKEIQTKHRDKDNDKPASSLPSIPKDKIPKELQSHCAEGKAGYWEMDFSDTKRRRRSKPAKFLEDTTEKQQKPRAKDPSTKMTKKQSNQKKASSVSKTSEFRQKVAPKQPKEKLKFPSISNTSEAIDSAEKNRAKDSNKKPSATAMHKQQPETKASQTPIPKLFIPRNLQTHCEDPSGGYWDIDFSSRRRQRTRKSDTFTVETKRKQKRGKTKQMDRFEKTKQAPKGGSKNFPIELEPSTTKVMAGENELKIAGPKKIMGTTKWAWDEESSLNESSKEPNKSLSIELESTNANATEVSASPEDDDSSLNKSSNEPNKSLSIELESTNANATEVSASRKDDESSLNEFSNEPHKGLPIELESTTFNDMEASASRKDDEPSLNGSSKEPKKSLTIESESTTANITETSASPYEFQMKGPRKISATNQWAWLIPLDPEPEESVEDNLETNSSPKKKRKPRRCLRCVEHGAPLNQARECLGSAPRWGRSACEFFAADLGAKPAAKPKAKSAKKAKPAVPAEPESEREPESGSELPSIDDDFNITWYFPYSEERERRPEERKRRRCMRCVENGAPSSQAEDCNGSKGHLGRDACQHFGANGDPRTTETTTHQDSKNKNVILRIVAGDMRMGRPLVFSNLPPANEPLQEEKKKKKKKKQASPARSQDAMSNRKFENFMSALKDAADLIDSESKRGHFDYPKPDQEAVVLV